MSIIIASHRVRDFHSWKPYYDGDAPRRKAAGLKEVTVGRKAEDPNQVYMIWETKDPSGIQKMSNDPELKQLMQKAGVISPLEITVLNEG
jgi:hypothetical protein